MPRGTRGSPHDTPWLSCEPGETNERSAQTRKTWEDAVSVIQVPAVYRLARELGWDALQLLRAIRSMKRAMAVSKIVYGVVIAERL